MEEKVLEAFSELGFILEKNEIGYSFSYEGINMMWMYNEQDEDFLSISVPGIWELEENDAANVCLLMEKINSTLRYVKAYILGGSVWIFYERELQDSDDLPLVISRMIRHLEAALMFARKVVVELEDSEDENGSAEEITDGSDD